MATNWKHPMHFGTNATSYFCLYFLLSLHGLSTKWLAQPMIFKDFDPHRFVGDSSGIFCVQKWEEICAL
jgi:hypothetical protein